MGADAVLEDLGPPVSERPRVGAVDADVLEASHVRIVNRPVRARMPTTRAPPAPPPGRTAPAGGRTTPLRCPDRGATDRWPGGWRRRRPTAADRSPPARHATTAS